MMKYLSKSAQETKSIAEKLARQIPQKTIALMGELGSGKTTFVQGFAKGLGIKEKIISPTFVLIKQHKIPNTNNLLYHIDLYRLKKEEEFKNLGLWDLLNPSHNLLLIEWADKIEKYLPNNAINIFIDKKKGNLRLITVS